MTPNPTRKEELLPALADHVLLAGLQSASLRPLAAAAGTSDRMLIYHFGSKDALIAEVLALLAKRMAALLDQALGVQSHGSGQALVHDIIAVMRSDLFQPYVRVWLEIVAISARGDANHRKVGAEIMTFFHGWLAARHPAGAQGASQALTLIEGVLVMDAVGHRITADDGVSAA